MYSKCSSKATNTHTKSGLTPHDSGTHIQPDNPEHPSLISHHYHSFFFLLVLRQKLAGRYKVRVPVCERELWQDRGERKDDPSVGFESGKSKSVELANGGRSQK